jgi:hypothetical protein
MLYVQCRTNRLEAQYDTVACVSVAWLCSLANSIGTRDAIRRRYDGHFDVKPFTGSGLTLKPANLQSISEYCNPQLHLGQFLPGVDVL